MAPFLRGVLYGLAIAVGFVCASLLLLFLIAAFMDL